ncbi:MAG: hypothetical protein LAO03_07925 [Acidobacteriia bacterium]|nr:hypothetical protein [Terriglobia bacterium]
MRTAWLLPLVLVACSVWAAPPAGGKAPLPAVRWAEGNPGCTFERGEDGKYRYGVWSGDVGVTLAIDSQELQKVHRRGSEPMVGVLLTVRYRGTDSLNLKTDHVSLEFVKHYHVIHIALDPEELATTLQSSADSFSDETEHEISKHPEKKEEKEAVLQAYQKDLTEMLEFLSNHSLRPAKLDTGTPEASGWLFFSTRSKWIGEWRKQEDLVLRIPLNNQLFEIPFSLPPTEGDLILRKRP